MEIRKQWSNIFKELKEKVNQEFFCRPKMKYKETVE
jgi:hypothetical protein